MADQANGRQVAKRHEIDEAYKWRLEDIYASDDEWEKEFARTKELIGAVEQYRGKVAESAATLLAMIKLYGEIFQFLDRVYGYANMRLNEDNQVSKYQAMSQRAAALYSEAQAALSFVMPEILEAPEERIRSYVETNAELKVYAHLLDDILRGKAHVLPAEEEQILGQMTELAHSPNNIFSMLTKADMRFGTVSGEDGREYELTYSRYQQFQFGPDRKLRKESFERLHEKFAEYKNTLAATYQANVKANVIFARIRRHESALEARLHPDNMPVSVYENLISAVRAHLPAFHRYLRLRREILGLDELRFYDVLAPLVSDVPFNVPYDEACDLVKAAVRPLGDEYGTILDKAVTSRWIDVYENEGKSFGAYMRNVYGVHPYILMNYQGTLRDVFTLAHELGHALHSYYTNRSQPFLYTDYSIFIAEIASNVHEALLVHHLQSVETDPKRRFAVLSHFLDEFRTSVFRQTLFAEFEKLAHESAERGEALTAESLTATYRRLIEEYYAPEVKVDDHIAIEWARVPHFYSAFYVYKYATGFAAAHAFANAILAGKEGAAQRYLDLLASGSSDYPLNLLARAGLDMSSPEPVNDAFSFFERLIDEAEELAVQCGLRR